MGEEEADVLLYGHTVHISTTCCEGHLVSRSRRYEYVVVRDGIDGGGKRENGMHLACICGTVRYITIVLCRIHIRAHLD